MKRLVAIVAVVAIVGALVAVAVRSGSRLDSTDVPDYDPAAPTPSAGPATTAPDPRLGRFYAQTLDWNACGGTRCATLEVPLDYAHPGRGTIRLNVVMRLADDQDDKVGALVVNPGGPGAPGSAEAEQAASYFREPLLRYFDIVGFDPRGTGDSEPVDCLSDADLDAFLAADPDPDTPTEEQTFARATRSLGRGCVELSGNLASHISTIESARDMDVLRAALGERAMSYFGSSYGTELGATYAELFPDRVGRFVLDGAVDPKLDNLHDSLAQAKGFETALRAYVANCVETSDSCFLGRSVEDGLATISGLLDQVDDEPLPTSLGRPLTQGLAVNGIIAPLYSRSYWIVLSSALRSALDGNGTQLLQLADAYASRNADGTYVDNLMEAFPAISCLDDPEGLSVKQVPTVIPQFENASPTLGRIFAWGMVGCHDWPARSTEKPLTIDAAGAAPIVVIGTTRDPATPMEWATALASQLDSGVLIQREGDGHTGYNSDNDCVDEAVEHYLIEGKVPADGLRC